mmetsp:Transcript_4851/g.4602  ORF Transcript_4851/g.4602 Transcript_4851/m.4602 type:complete len:334 (-) Transcript_4851:690-1691(-)
MTLRSDPKKLSNNFWLLIFFIVLFSLSIASFTIHYPIKSAYWFSNINEQFFNKPYTYPDVHPNGTAYTATSQFMKIDTLEAINIYMKYFFKLKFLSADSSDSPSFLNNKKILYGPYRIHTRNVKISECVDGVDISRYNGTHNGVDYNLNCLSGSINKENLTSSEAGTFRTAGQAKLNFDISGEYSLFDGDGYTWDIYPTKMNQSTFDTEYDTLVDAGFIGEQTVGLIISFTIYSKDLNKWAYNYAFLEKNLQGVIYTHFPNSIVFEPHRFDTIEEVIFFFIDIIKVIVIFIVCCYVIGWEFYLWKFKKNRRTLIVFIRTTMMQLLAIILTIIY